MTALPEDANRAARSARGYRDGLKVAALFLMLALVLRAPQFGNPVIQIDEQFYLLVGDRMWHGALPYVDLWDRKPPGLFLVYAAIRLLGGDGIVQYQIVASCFAAATATAIWAIARRIAQARGAVFAGAIYLIYLMVNGGDGGQAPVFYNLPVAIAAWAVVRAIERPAFDRAAFGFGCTAMALLGLAIQVKYSVLLEGLYFGLTLLAAARRQGALLLPLLAAGAAWVALALAPTGLALLWFVGLGHADAFVFANFQSIFLRPAFTSDDVGRRIAKIALRVLPMALVALASFAWRYPSRAPRARRFLLGWAVAAVVSLAVFGTYHDHYALPLLLPFAIAGAPVYAWLWRLPGRAGKGLRVPPIATGVALVGLVAAALIVHDARWRRGNGSEVRAMAARIALRPGERLFVFSGDPILYHLTASPLPTAWNFPTLLSERRDSNSLGTDMHRELARVMAARPRFVVTRDGYPFPEAEPGAWDYMHRLLAREYRLVLKQRVGPRNRLLYERKLAAPGQRIR